MAFIGNSMWKGDSMQPHNFANAVGAKQKSNPHSVSDSFIGTPLAVGANSPPAGPVSHSMQIAGAKQGYENSTRLGKALSISTSIGVSALLLPKGESNRVAGFGKSVLAGGATFYLLNYMYDKLR